MQIGNNYSTDITRVRDFVPVAEGYEKIIAGIKRAKWLNLLSTLLVLTLVLAFKKVFIITGIVGILLKLYVHIFMGILMEYELDEEFLDVYINMRATWLMLNRNKKFWQIVSESERDLKMSGGANRGVNRVPAKAIGKAPYYMKTNVNPFGLQLSGKQLVFLPDILLVVSGMRVGALSYDDVDVTFTTTEFIETGKVPKDAYEVDETWLRVNMDGSKDRRYNYNKQMPVCEYGKIIISSGEALYVEVMCSDSDTIANLQEYAEEMFG